MNQKIPKQVILEKIHEKINEKIKTKSLMIKITMIQNEQNHVRFGHRWLPEIMALFGEKRSVEEFVKATQEKFKQLAVTFGGKVPHSLPASKRLTAEKIVKLAGV